MNNRILTRMVLAAGAAVVLAGATPVTAQSADALLDKLVEKGILTVREANDLKSEADKNFTQAYQVKSGLPDWVNTFKFSGDIRARYEGFYSSAAQTNGAAFLDRNRFRYRLRLGATIVMLDNFEAGFRLTTSEPSGNFGGDPISGNSTFQDNGSKKFVYIDTAYGRWYALNGEVVSGFFTVGKMDNPFLLDDMVFDGDYTPEGGAANFAFRLNDKHSLKATAAIFVLDEFSGSSDDPYFLGAQARWDAVWNTKWTTTLGAAILSLQEKHMLTNNAVPNVNRGNTRNTSTGILKYAYNPVVIDAAITYTAPSFPFLYRGPFPIRVGGAYMNNPAATTSDNTGWNAGVMFGKSGKKMTWDLSYAYKWLGADAWYEEMVDSDFGAFYGGANSPSNSGFNAGYGAGTNVKGHILRLAFSPSDSVTLSVKWFLTELIDAVPGTDSEMNRFQADASWKF